MALGSNRAFFAGGVDGTSNGSSSVEAAATLEFLAPCDETWVALDGTCVASSARGDSRTSFSDLAALLNVRLSAISMFVAFVIFHHC